MRAGALIALIVAGLVTVLAPAAPAWACSCVAPDKVESLIDLRVIGTVTEVTDGSVRIAVDSVLKGGPVKGGEVRLRAGRGEASCGYDFLVGQRYSVSSIKGSTNLCSGNQPMPSLPPSAAPSVEPPREERPVAAPAREEPPPYGWAAGGAALVLLLAGLTVVVARRRRRPD